VAKRVECFYGQPATGKSEAALRVAKRVFEETGKKARVLIGDGSAATLLDSGLVDAGVAELCDYTIREWPSSTCQQLCEGYWPADPEDPKSPLLPPKPADLAKIGTYIIEGISVMGNYIMGFQKGGFAFRSGRGEKIGQDSPLRIVDGEVDALGNLKAGTGPGLQFGGNPLSHYGFAQKILLGCIERSKILPVDFVIWTGHERSAEDKNSKEIIIGPEAAGSAMTGNLQRYFNNTWHFATAEKRVKGKKDEHSEKLVDDLDIEYRLYTRDHFSPQGNVSFKFKAVTRGVSAETMPLFLTHDSPGDSVEEAYRIIKKARLERATALKADIAKAEAARSAQTAAA
jgi:DNA polymerase III delta prime subunit